MIEAHQKKSRSASSAFILGREPKTDKEYRAMANALIQWAQQETSLCIQDFLLNRLISPDCFTEFAKKSDYFARAYEIAIHMIGVRRERLAQQGVLNQQIVLATMPLYNPQYKRWIKCLKYKDDAAGETKIIVVKMPEIPSSPLVPTRKEDKG